MSTNILFASRNISCGRTKTPPLSFHTFKGSGLLVTINNDNSISGFDIKSNCTLRFTTRPDVFFSQNEILKITEILSPFNCKKQVGTWTLVVLFSDGSVQFLDTLSGICYLSGPANSVCDPFGVSVFHPLMSSLKRYILMVSDDEIIPENFKEDTDLFDMNLQTAHSTIRIMDSWSMTVVDVPLISPIKIKFVRKFNDSLFFFGHQNNLHFINISMLNTNSHMKISEDLKMDSLIEQITNIFQYCGCMFYLGPVFDLVEATLSQLQRGLNLGR